MATDHKIGIRVLYRGPKTLTATIFACGASSIGSIPVVPPSYVGCSVVVARCKNVSCFYLGVAQIGSACGLGPQGREFKSHHPDQSDLS